MPTWCIRWRPWPILQGRSLIHAALNLHDAETVSWHAGMQLNFKKIVHKFGMHAKDWSTHEQRLPDHYVFCCDSIRQTFNIHKQESGSAVVCCRLLLHHERGGRYR